MPVGTVEIHLDKTRHLRFDINALADVEQKLGISIDTLLDEERLGIDAVRMLLWSGLKWEDRRLTPEAAGNLIQEKLDANKGAGLAQTLQELMEPLGEALLASGFAEKEEDGDEATEGKSEDVAS